jgi:hypothetical protein
MDNPGDAARYTLRALAERYRALDHEARLHERILATLTDRVAPTLTSRFGIAADSAAELLLVVGDNPERIRSEAALAKLCGACPIPASSGKTSRHRLNRGGHRQANATLHRILIVRMRFHEPTITYVTRRTTEGKTKKEILRCLKRHLIREIYQTIVAPHKRNELAPAADNYRSINALAESVIGLYKTELITPQRPWKGVDDLEIATAEWVDWFNHRRPLEYCDDLTPAEAEQAHYAHHQSPATAALSN